MHTILLQLIAHEWHCKPRSGATIAIGELNNVILLIFARLGVHKSACDVCSGITELHPGSGAGPLD